jgi:signal transduction histidine kinase
LTAEEWKNIFLIYKEAIHNIVRYAECKKVEINFNMEKDNLIMTIKDNGKGFDIASQNARLNNESLGGNGLKNMQTSVENINGKFNVQTSVNTGTIITFSLKV